MQTNQLGATGIAVSRIGLGTVEIGVPGYGVGKRGIISEKDSIYLLQAAVDMGVTYIDTARGYGLAEERIGKSGVSAQKGVTVGTKCGQFLRETPDMPSEDIFKKIREEVNESRRLLGYDTLPLVQLHIERADYSNLDVLAEIMSILQHEKKVGHVGVASRGFTVPNMAIESDFFETVQVAYNILDQRMSGGAPTTTASSDNSTNAKMSDILSLAGARNIGVINRSVLLKGALTPARSHLPEPLTPLKDAADTAAILADELGIDLPTLAIRFCISHPHISTSLIGTTKVERIEQAVAAATAGPLDTATLTRLYSLGITDENQVDPANWPKE